MRTGRKFAEKTKVPAERSRAEIEKMLTRYGANQFVTGFTEDGAVVGFRANERNIRFEIAIPKSTPAMPWGLRERAEQEKRRLWRALTMVIKAKLEAVESGISIFEEEFLAYIVLPGGKTVAQSIGKQISEAYATGKVPRLLLTSGGDEG